MADPQRATTQPPGMRPQTGSTVMPPILDVNKPGPTDAEFEQQQHGQQHSDLTKEQQQQRAAQLAAAQASHRAHTQVGSRAMTTSEHLDMLTRLLGECRLHVLALDNSAEVENLLVHIGNAERQVPVILAALDDSVEDQ